MCRLFAFASAKPRTVAQVMEASDLVEFTALSRFHGDGWGSAWLRDPGTAGAAPAGAREVADSQAVVDGTARLGRLRSTRAAYDDPAFDRFVHHQPTTAGLVHLRWASPGMPVEPANQHPFLQDAADEAAFAHNGSIEWTQDLTDEGRRAWAATGLEAPGWVGATDSERYFWLVRAYRAAGAPWPEALAQAHAAIRRHAAPCGINAVLVTPEAVIAVHAAAGRQLTGGALASHGLTGSDVPRDHTEAYYRLALRQSADEVAVVSSGLPTDGWEPIPDETMVVIDAATLAVAVAPLGAA